MKQEHLWIIGDDFSYLYFDLLKNEQSIKFLCDKHFLIANTNPSQIIRKLNPMNSPSTPPMSATSEVKENASFSFRTKTYLDVK